jgi:hypothetical protein
LYRLGYGTVWGLLGMLRCRACAAVKEKAASGVAHFRRLKQN